MSGELNAEALRVWKLAAIECVEIGTYKLRQRLDNIERKIDNMAATQADLDAAIAALPGQVQAAVDAALAPVILAIKAKVQGAGVDLSAEVASLAAVGGTVATSVATDIATTG